DPCTSRAADLALLPAPCAAHPGTSYHAPLALLARFPWVRCCVGVRCTPAKAAQESALCGVFGEYRRGFRESTLGAVMICYDHARYVGGCCGDVFFAVIVEYVLCAYAFRPTSEARAIPFGFSPMPRAQKWH